MTRRGFPSGDDTGSRSGWPPGETAAGAAPDDAASTFTAWAEGRQQALARTAFLLSGDLHRAEDLVQEALTKVALRWGRLRHGDPDAYARRILVRDNVSWWRRRRGETTVEDVPEKMSDSDRQTAEQDAAERRLMVGEALRRLTAKQRAVLVLRYYEDLTEAATAELLGVSVGTVKSQSHAALARLRATAPELADRSARPDRTGRGARPTSRAWCSTTTWSPARLRNSWPAGAQVT